jgi:ribosomal protein S18 acetylase RimI-like enzyme
MTAAEVAPAWRIRAFVPADTDAVVALWQGCGLTRPWNDPLGDIARKATTQPELFLVGTLDERVVATAMVGYDGHRGWVNYLAVAPSCRLGGHARALMQEAERLLALRGCPKLNLQLRRTNTAAAGFYRALGYVEDDVVCFGKRLIVDPPAGDRATADR